MLFKKFASSLFILPLSFEVFASNFTFSHSQATSSAIDYSYKPPPMIESSWKKFLDDHRVTTQDKVNIDLVEEVIVIPVNATESEKRTLAKEVDTFYKLGSGVMAIMFMMPAEVTNWDEAHKSTNFEKWQENAYAPMAVDEDDWYINYLGHPLSGAAYYTAARHNGFGQIGSFFFSFIMSYSFWENGLEATVETPSKQDTIITPTFGWLYGEALYQLHNYISDNKGYLFGSKTAGNIGLLISDISGATQNGLKLLTDNTEITDLYMGLAPIDLPKYNDNEYEQAEQIIGFRIKLKWK